MIQSMHPQDALRYQMTDMDKDVRFYNGIEIEAMREFVTGQNIASEFGNDDRLMEQALDMEEGAVASKVVLEAQAERILKKLQVLERLGEDVYDNEAVLLFKFRYTAPGSDTYTFAALKAAGMWFLTGAKSNGSYKSWDELVDFFTSRGEVVEMWMATDWENVLG